MIRKVEETGRPIAIIADMQGPKLRVGKFKDGKIELTVGQKLRLDLDSTPGDQTRQPSPSRSYLNTMTIGSHILLDDGKVRMEIVDKGDSF